MTRKNDTTESFTVEALKDMVTTPSMGAAVVAATTTSSASSSTAPSVVIQPKHQAGGEASKATPPPPGLPNESVNPPLHYGTGQNPR